MGFGWLERSRSIAVEGGHASYVYVDVWRVDVSFLSKTVRTWEVLGAHTDN